MSVIHDIFLPRLSRVIKNLKKQIAKKKDVLKKQIAKKKDVLKKQHHTFFNLYEKNVFDMWEKYESIPTVKHNKKFMKKVLIFALIVIRALLIAQDMLPVSAKAGGKVYIDLGIGMANMSGNMTPYTAAGSYTPHNGRTKDFYVYKLSSLKSDAGVT